MNTNDANQRDKKKKPILAQISEYASLAFMLPAATVTGYFFGVLLDRHFHTTYLTIVFLILGMVAGFVEMFKIVTKKSK
jgi:F0F1-type ATP synthase assembly protein I